MVVNWCTVSLSRGLLDDQNFHADIRGLADEPIPYFRQFQTNENARERVGSVAFHDDMDLGVTYPSLKVCDLLFIFKNKKSELHRAL